ncbi:FecR domain-containing protein [Saccharicrinis fermentans]|nr:FecR domain-containing protein [Saccharicrinis fermentans]
MIRKSKSKNYSKLLRIFLCGLCLLAFVSVNVEAQDGRKVKVSIEVKNQTLVNIFKSIENQSGYHFAFANNVIDDDKTYSLKYSDESIYVVLDFLGGMAGFDYKVSGRRSLFERSQK